MAVLQCPVCGREGEGVCLDCFLEKKPIGVTPISLCVCNCGRVRSRGMWGDVNEKTFDNLIRHSIKVPRDLILEKVKTSVNPDGTVRAVLDLVYKGGKVKKELDVPVVRAPSTCQVCSRKSASYYEAVLQVRGDDYSFPMKDEFLMKAEKVRGGADYYMTSMNYAKQRAHDFWERGYFMKESSALVSKKDGQDLYRVYISVKHPDFNPGDVIRHKDALFLVRGLGRLVKLSELDTGKKTAYPVNQMKEAKVVVPKAEVRGGIVTAVKPKGIMVLDTTNYQNHEFPVKRDLKQGDEVNIAVVSGKAHLL